MLTLAAGLLLRPVLGLQPIPWLAWVAPALLLWLAIRIDGGTWAVAVFAAALVGTSVGYSYYGSLMPPLAAVGVVVAQALLWLAVAWVVRRVVRRWRAPWTIVAFPTAWAGIDTVMAAFLPDGNWGSYAYTQAGVLTVAQVASLAGVAGILWTVCLVPSAIAVTAWLGPRARGIPRMLVLVALLVTAVLSFGAWRLRAPHGSASLPVGLAAMDEFVDDGATPAVVETIQRGYLALVGGLAGDGARVIVLPEKLAIVAARDVPRWRETFSSAARQHAVWLVAGIGVERQAGISNEAWLFAPDGRLDAVYRKHFMAPPERGAYVSGTDWTVADVMGVPAGLAICKDMHFASLGRAYGERGAPLMLVPAWDFHVDRFMAARLTAIRGIENGYAIARASRDGLLTATDDRGRVVGEIESGPLPGRRLLVTLTIPPSATTLYTKTGDLLGWASLAAAVVLAVAASFSRGGRAAH